MGTATVGAMPASILLVDDEEDTVSLLALTLRNRGFIAETVASGHQCLERVRHGDVDIVVTDHQMPGMSGVELCHELAIRDPDVLSLILTGMSSLDVAIEAIRAGAYDFLTKPVRGDVLEIAVRRALEHQRVRIEVKRLRQGLDEDTPIDSIVGTSTVMRAMMAMIRRVAPSDATALITGESGTGKELVARALHALSPRKNEPFVAINCAAMPPALLESELFGHVRGAFTDAKNARAGLFIQAGRGTIFLDEIGEMPQEMQSKLLRVLQERSVRPVGGDEETPFHARVVTATNRDLETEVDEKRFREDLYHRVNVVAIQVPSLRERSGDILEIAKVVLGRISARTGKAAFTLSAGAARKLVDYTWPGNVRELENSLERAVAMARGSEIDVDCLPKKVIDYTPTSIEIQANDPEDLIELEAMAKRYVRQVLDSVGGNKSQAARILGIDRRSLYRRLE